ncbi:MAG TPA: alanine--tRNA ligase [Candidatus Binatia bacterium]|jgi:alanyl-tRNA synthetase|nr:alanine--tRNA ligase [Candidatus Binatia bacterium]
MTSAEIRQSFLDFFKSKGHAIVPSSSLMPDSPNLLFTNAGMNQFVPIFLGQRAPDVSKWPGAIPGSDTRAADTQKCIRAGGKHNDLEDVGLDTYHHTFFEMLGNWSFGDYFKKEAIAWAWELVTEVWKFPKNRLYATVFCPHMDPARWRIDLEGAIDSAQTRLDGGLSVYVNKTSAAMTDSDEEAASYWAELFLKAGLDPFTHIVPGDKKDNFWMMGETGPCGPCSEIHFDLTPQGDSKGRLVNQGSAECIEIWNLVFIQFNANADGSFSPLPAKHVDTGMGLDRVTSFIQCTKNFTDFNGIVSNYETDAFRPLFDKIEKLSGKKYCSTLPAVGTTGASEQEKIDIAFRVIADHIRTLGFAIADGIIPSNEGRGYVLRRILRRAVRYGRSLGFHEPFFYKLVSVLAEKMGHVFPELRTKQEHVEEVIQREETAFNKTLDIGIRRFNEVCVGEVAHSLFGGKTSSERASREIDFLDKNLSRDFDLVVDTARAIDPNWSVSKVKSIRGERAFELYDTYGFPLDLTELMARERGLIVDVAGFNKLMEEQKARARAAQKKTTITLQDDVDLVAFTEFVGFKETKVLSRVLKAIPQGKRWAVVLPESPLYAEMGGQVGDTGTITARANIWPVVDTKKVHLTWLHIIDGDEPPEVGTQVSVEVDLARRHAIERHHTVTHLLHWALHEVVSPDAVQKGSYVGPDKLTFDFSSAALTPQQVADVEKLVNERILDNAPVSWTEIPYPEAKSRKDIMQFFGEKYGDKVRVVQIGGKPAGLNGYSMELCGGTHTRATGEIGLFRIVAESAIAAGIRRIEAVSGLEAYKKANEELQLIKTLSGKVNSPVGELEKKIESLLAQQKELEKQLKGMQQKQAVEVARGLIAKAQTLGSTRTIVENLGAGDGDFLQAVADALKGQFKGVVVLGGATNGAVALVATVSPEFTKQVQAGKIIQTIAPIVGGKGGGRPDNARGGGKDVAKLDEALGEARKLIQR